MKKIIPLFITLVGLIVVTVIALTIYNTENDGLIITNYENIKKIVITEYAETKTTENKNDIANIVNYINSLDLEKTSYNGYDCFGTGYFITVYFDHKILCFNYTIRKKFVHIGNRYFRKSGNWYEIKSKYIDFTPIYDIISDN